MKQKLKSSHVLDDIINCQRSPLIKAGLGYISDSTCSNNDYMKNTYYNNKYNLSDWSSSRSPAIIILCLLSLHIIMFSVKTIIHPFGPILVQCHCLKLVLEGIIIFFESKAIFECYGFAFKWLSLYEGPSLIPIVGITIVIRPIPIGISLRYNHQS